MNIPQIRSFLLLMLCVTVMAGCERKPAASSAPEPQTLYGRTRDQTSYTFLKWNEGLAIMLVDRCEVHHNSSSSGRGKPDQRRGDAHWWDRDSDEWKNGYEWQLETADGQTAVFAIDGVEYDLSKGALFRIDTGGDEAAVTQVDQDISRIQPAKNACDHFVTSTPELRKPGEGSNTGNADGTWIVQSVVRDPREKGEGEGKGLRIIISGLNAEVKAIGEDKSLGKAVIRIDPTKKPKAIDITGEGEMEAVRGIYELEGDNLRVCWGPDEKKERPTQLTSTPGSGQNLVVLKRE